MPNRDRGACYPAPIDLSTLVAGRPNVRVLEPGVEFFEKQGAGAYKDLKALTRRQDLAAAELLNAEVSGRALSVGGVWEYQAPGPRLKSLAALDLSGEMLRSYAPKGVETIVGDLYEKDFPRGSFDTVVFSLVLHHVARGGWSECRRRVQAPGAGDWEWFPVFMAVRWLKLPLKVYPKMHVFSGEAR